LAIALARFFGLPVEKLERRRRAIRRG